MRPNQVRAADPPKHPSSFARSVNRRWRAAAGGWIWAIEVWRWPHIQICRVIKEPFLGELGAPTSRTHKPTGKLAPSYFRKVDFPSICGNELEPQEMLVDGMQEREENIVNDIGNHGLQVLSRDAHLAPSTGCWRVRLWFKQVVATPHGGIPHQANQLPSELLHFRFWHANAPKGFELVLALRPASTLLSPSRRWLSPFLRACLPGSGRLSRPAPCSPK